MKEFKVSLDYRVSFRAARATQRKADSKERKKGERERERGREREKSHSSTWSLDRSEICTTTV